jgi:hypothetical protein
MAINFPHSTRALRNDGMLPTTALLAIAGSLLVLWGAWFVLARVPITVICTQAQLGREGALVAHCPPGQAARLTQGDPTLVIITSGGSRQVIEAVILRVSDLYTRDLAPDTVEVYPFIKEPLPAGAAAEVHVEVATVSPLQLVLRGDPIRGGALSGVSRP